MASFTVAVRGCISIATVNAPHMQLQPTFARFHRLISLSHLLFLPHVACAQRYHSLSMLICNLSPPPLQFNEGPLLQPTLRWVTPLSWFYPVTVPLSPSLSYFYTISFRLCLLLSSLSPPSSCLSDSSHTASPSLIMLYGGFAVGSPRHEWSINRSPGGSGPYNSVQWARIVSQLTQEILSVITCFFFCFWGCILTV